MWIGLLGPLVVRGADVPLAVGAAKQRVVLAALALRAGRVVPSDELVEAVWDECPSQGARVTLRNYVFRLRVLLAPAGGRIITRDPGYLLEAADSQVDVLQFGALCSAGGAALRSGEWERAVEVLGEALGLWRGAPLADVPSRVLRQEWVGVLERDWLRAVEWRVEARLQLGRHNEVLGELERLCAGHPLNERLHVLRMLALYRAGRPGESLAVYRQARQVLVDELGVEPGEELRRLHQQILARDPALAAPGGAAPVAQTPVASWERPERAEWPAVVPRQLPASVAHFAGRSVELGALSLLAEQASGGGGADGRGADGRGAGSGGAGSGGAGSESDAAGTRAGGAGGGETAAGAGGGAAGSGAAGSGAGVISALGGAAGVGKTALAVHFAHQVAGRFPDGQLYADLRGFSPAGEPVAPAQAVRGFLAALGVPPQAIPPDADSQVALYRSLLAGRRVLVVLDNARDVAQVRPLLPGSAGCLVVVTSRNQLTGLAAGEGAELLTLGLLNEEEAGELLAGRLGAGRVAEEPLAVRALIGLCARLPLALAIAAARAAGRPGYRLAAVAAELREAGGPLGALDTGEVSGSVRAVFSWSYRLLTPPAARMFRCLGLHPGPDISVRAAAALAGVETAQARMSLTELASSHLITEHSPGRYGFHDLLRAYATERALAEDSDADRHKAINQVLDYYVYSAATAAGLLNPSLEPVALTRPLAGVTRKPSARVTPEPLADRQEALAWFEAEHAVLLAAVGLAAETGLDRYCWDLPSAMWLFLDWRGQFPELAAIQRTALDAAVRFGDPAKQAAAHRILGGALAWLPDYEQARAHLTASLGLYRQLADRVGEARSLMGLAWMSDRRGHYDDALSHAEQALALLEAAGDRAGLARALNSRGWYQTQLGDYHQAQASLRKALALQRDGGDRWGEANTWDSLGYAEQQAGHLAEAATCYQHALGLFRDCGDQANVATVLTHLGDTHDAAGTIEAASAAWREALAILDDCHHPDATKVRAKLRRDSPEQVPARMAGAHAAVPAGASAVGNAKAGPAVRRL
jgi:DNA-binding SARP family transcriptional activator/Tfp pilus assembly protein PilF